MILQAIGLGDSYGAGFEFAPEDFVQEHNFPGDGYVQNPKYKSLLPGRYTDDCQSSIAMAAVMLRDLWTPGGVAKALLTAFNQDRRPGYAGGYFRFLSECKDASDYLLKIRPGSDKAGAAMRSIPVGLTPDVFDLKHRSILHASLTHATPEGIASAQATALMFHLLYYRKATTRLELVQMLDLEVPGWEWNREPLACIPNEGVPCVRAVVHVLEQSTTMHDVFSKSVALTGDVDTVAALAVPCAMYAPWIGDKTIPQALLDGFEDGKFGTRYLQALDTALVKAYPRPEAGSEAIPDTEVTEEDA
jgi:ADP-ribosyl-[dinitrogen reductase] hydrolase